MVLNVSGELKEYPDDITVEEWMALEKIENPEVALIQVNSQDILPKHRTMHILRNGDALQLMYFLGDG